MSRRSRTPDGPSVERKGLQRIMSYPSALKDIKWKPMFHRVSNQIKDFKKTAVDLVTLNVENNECKLCPHKYSCVQNAVYKGLFRSFAAGYLFKTFLALMQAVFSGKLGRKGRTLRDIFRGEDAIRFGQFIGILSFLYKVVLCSLRRYTGRNSPYYNMIAGFVSGISIILDDPARRSSIALYCVVRALADLYQNLKSTNMIQKIPHGSALTFTAAQVPIMFAYVKSPTLLNKAYLAWISRMGRINDVMVRNTMCSRISGSMNRLPGEEWRPCGFHADPNCLRYNITDWFLGLGRASRIYMPVHLLPTLLFNPGKVAQNPGAFVKRVVQNVARSSIFLTTYQANVKMTHCFVRNAIKDDPVWTALLSGITAGLSIFIEHPRRRTELTLYVLPRALEASFNYVLKYHGRGSKLLRGSIPVVSVIGFQSAMAIWMYAQANPKWEKMNGLNRSGLKAVFGSRH